MERQSPRIWSGMIMSISGLVDLRAAVVLEEGARIDAVAAAEEHASVDDGIDDRLSTLDWGSDNYYAEYQKGIEEYAAECVIVKVCVGKVLRPIHRNDSSKCIHLVSLLVTY